MRQLSSRIVSPCSYPGAQQQRNLSVAPPVLVIWCEAPGGMATASPGPTGRVSVPTLVTHSRDDAALPFDAGRELAASIPGARFVPLESRNHIILEQEPAWQRFRTEIKGFLKAPQ